MEEITEYLLNKSRKKLDGALNTIAKRIVDKECSLFVGSGMSLNSNLPSWHQLLTPCADELEIPIHPYSDLFSLAQYYANCKSDSELRRIVNDQIDLLAKSTPLHDKLVMAGFKSIWTTNYDMLIEDSLRNDHIAFNTIISDSDLAKVSYEGRINVYKINGDTNNRNAMVLTQRDIESYTKTHQLFLTFPLIPQHYSLTLFISA